MEVQGDFTVLGGLLNGTLSYFILLLEGVNMEGAVSFGD